MPNSRPNSALSPTRKSPKGASPRLAPSTSICAAPKWLTSRSWGGQYVWYSHRQQALDAGLSAAFITAMAAGERPAKMSPDEATVYDFCSQLLTTRQVSDNNFKSMANLVGERGVVDLVALMGQYTGLTMLFVVDRYPVPPGAPDEVNKPM